MLEVVTFPDEKPKLNESREAFFFRFTLEKMEMSLSSNMCEMRVKAKKQKSI